MAAVFESVRGSLHTLAVRKLPRRPAPLVNKIFRGSTMVKKGLLTRADLRSTAWQQLFRDIYADRAMTITHERRCRAASRLLIPDGAAIAGRSAAHLWGVPFVDKDRAVEVLSPRDFGPVAGLAVHRGALADAETVTIGRITVTSPLRTCWDLVRWLDLVEALVFLDVLVARRLVSVEDLREYAGQMAGKPGAARLIKAASLIDPAAESPQETRLRAGLVLAGLPKPKAQHVIRQAGSFVARVDLAWEELRIAIEYDGRWHGDPSQLEGDRRRLNRLVAADWLVFHVTAKQLRDNFAELVQQLRSAIRSRRRELVTR